MSDLTKADELDFLQDNPFSHIHMISDTTWEQIEKFNVLYQNPDCPESLRIAINVLYEKLETGRILVKDEVR